MSRFADPSSRALPGAGDRVLVAGLGRSGEPAARALLRLGAAVTIADDRNDAELRDRAASLAPANAILGGAIPAMDGFDLVVTSPGVRPASPLLSAAFAAGLPLWSEVELGYRLSHVPVLGVTGTNGKTTTTEMLAAAIRAGGRRVVAAGNIGTALCDAARSDADVIVAELSSFQLHFAVSLHVPVGVLLNLAADHLDWHGSFDAYCDDKARLFELQQPGDAAVVFDDERCRHAARSAGGDVVPFATGAPPDGGAGVDAGWIVTPGGRVAEASKLRVRGAAMLTDAIAAAAAACAFGVPPELAGEALIAFDPAPHRMELVASAGGVDYVNDSKATNPHATLAALDGLGRVVLIAGGRNKGLDLSPLAGASNVVAVVAIGETAPEIEAAFRGHLDVRRCSSMDEAVERATSLAQPGDTVLLSPACASFDMFADYKARGEAFRAAVKRVLNAPEGGIR